MNNKTGIHELDWISIADYKHKQNEICATCIYFKKSFWNSLLGKGECTIKRVMNVTKAEMIPVSKHIKNTGTNTYTEVKFEKASVAVDKYGTCKFYVKEENA